MDRSNDPLLARKAREGLEREERKPPLSPATGSEMPWSEIESFAKRLVKEPRGQRRAANLIREIALELAKVQACEDLANASMELQRMLVLSWELRWDAEKQKGEK